MQEGLNTSNSPGLSADLAAWIGRRSERADVLSSRISDSFSATLAPHLALQRGAPLGAFWCLAPDIVGRSDLGPDGHPRTGQFLPALPYPRRMWAGGELQFVGAFRVGDHVRKTSTIENIALKTGSTGRLAFVTVRHEYRVGEELVLAERQDIVYRDAARIGTPPKSAPKPMSPDPLLRAWTVDTDPTLLFRYSALTFNGHRIHYDHPYATQVEGYEGLVVHGPLQATLMLNLAADVLGRTPERFTYRGQSPLICTGGPFQVEASAHSEASLRLRVVSERGTATMVAEAA